MNWKNGPPPPTVPVKKTSGSIQVGNPADRAWSYVNPVQLVFGENAPRDFILMLPYLATVLGIWISARLRGGAVVNSAELRDS